MTSGLYFNVKILCQGKILCPKKTGLPKTTQIKKPGDAGNGGTGFIFPCHIAVRQVTAGGGTDSSALPHSTPYGAKPQPHGSRSGDRKLSFKHLSRSENPHHSGLKRFQHRTTLFLKLWKSVMKQEKLYI